MERQKRQCNKIGEPISLRHLSLAPSLPEMERGVAIETLAQGDHYTGIREGERHSVLYPKKEWQSDFTGKLLRGHGSLTGDISKEQHQLLHGDVSKVPLPDRGTLIRAHEAFRSCELHGELGAATRKLMDAFQYASLEASDRDRRLVQLTIEYLEAQLPYLS